MKHWADRMGLRTDPAIFFISAICTVVFVIALVIAPEPIGDAFAAGRAWIVSHIGWFFILFGVFIVITGIYYWLKRPRKGRYL